MLFLEDYLVLNPTNVSQQQLFAPMIIPISTLRQILQEAQERRKQHLHTHIIATKQRLIH